MITFQVESWDQYYRDPAREGLWREHYNELAQAHGFKEEMSPDIESYAAMDRAGILVILVAREAGRLVGYCTVVVKRHLHYPTLCGFEDSYYLTPAARKGTAGYRLIAEMVKVLRRRGCRKSYWMTKQFASVSVLFKRLGMTLIDEVWVCKEL